MNQLNISDWHIYGGLKRSFRNLAVDFDSAAWHYNVIVKVERVSRGSTPGRISEALGHRGSWGEATSEGLGIQNRARPLARGAINAPQ